MNKNFKENINFPNYWNWKGFKICWSVTGEDNEIPIIFSTDLALVENIGETIQGILRKGIMPHIPWT